MHRLAPIVHISCAHRARKDGSRVGMNVTAHQEKEKNEKTKTAMKKAGERRRQATHFRKAVCCSSAIVQGAAWRENVAECPG